jgi:hypothetical protein
MERGERIIEKGRKRKSVCEREGERENKRERERKRKREREREEEGERNNFLYAEYEKVCLFAFKFDSNK